eukprot:357392-Chlamydomonas_euryale.AAC.56
MSVPHATMEHDGELNCMGERQASTNSHFYYTDVEISFVAVVEGGNFPLGSAMCGNCPGQYVQSCVQARSQSRACKACWDPVMRVSHGSYRAWHAVHRSITARGVPDGATSPLPQVQIGARRDCRCS